MSTATKSAAAIVSILLAAPAPALAASPPDRLNYSGVLRDASNTPLDGTFDMVFRLWDSETLGNEILLDRHLAAGTGGVTVTGGLFNVEIGAGSLHDGSGPGLYTDLASVFRDYGDVWLEVQVGAETLAPRTRIIAAAYALNSTHLDGRAAAAFLDTSSTPQTKSGQATFNGQSYGVVATGDVAGSFAASSGGSRAWVGKGDFGIWSSGNVAGGYFEDAGGSGRAYAGYGDYGIQAFGNVTGGHFLDADHSGEGYVGFGDFGIYGRGNGTGGYFTDSDGTGYAYVAIGDYGVQAFGNAGGGYLADLDSSGVAFLGTADRGIWGKGNFAGGTFSHPDNVTFWADVSTPTRKIVGTGTVSFVQNHPYERDKVVVYAAPEGDEVGVYTRGSARLVRGEARIRLGESFAWVANPDIGLTAHLTPRDEPIPLSVASVSPSELVVRGPAGANAAFDFIVYGLRIGFEDLAPVQIKDREAFLPGREAVEATYAGHPDLRRFNAMERFKGMRAALGESSPLDLSRGQAMAAAIDAHRDEVVAKARADADAERARMNPARVERPDVPRDATPRAGIPLAPPAPSPARDVTPVAVAMGSLSTVTVSENVVPGEVLSIDAERPGSLRRADAPLDAGVAGCVAEAPEGTDLAAGQALVATSGVVVCLADASFGPIAPGDLLTTSANPGHAARADEAPQGAILGKAMEALAAGTGPIRVLMR